MFITSKKIWEDIGEFIEGFTEEYINSMIYRNSIEVVELIDELAAQQEAVENVTYKIEADGDFCMPMKATSSIRKWRRSASLFHNIFSSWA